MSSSLERVFAVIGHGRRARARDERSGEQLGYSEVTGSRTTYYAPSGRRLGSAVADGPYLRLVDAAERLVGLYRRA